MESLFCSYRNSSDRMVIVRCCGPQDFFLERVVFPFELLTFHCPPASDVQIWRHGTAGGELLESVEAEDLHSRDPLPPPRRDWFPPTAARSVAVRGNASSVCFESY
jgi:hypothetical protein